MRKRGDQVAEGEPLAQIHAATDADADEAASELKEAYVLADEPPPRRPVVLDVIA